MGAFLVFERFRSTREDVMVLVRMDHHEKMRIRAAAFRATRVYPGPVGELISRELLVWEDFGYRLSGSGLILQLVDHIMKTELPTATATVPRSAIKSTVGYGG